MCLAGTNFSLLLLELGVLFDLPTLITFQISQVSWGILHGWRCLLCLQRCLWSKKPPPPTPPPFSYWGPAASQNSPWCLSFSLLSESVSSPAHFFHLCVVSRIHLFLPSYGHALVWTRIAYPRTPLPRPLGLGLQCCTYNVCSTLSPHDPRKAYSSSFSAVGGSALHCPGCICELVNGAGLSLQQFAHTSLPFSQALPWCCFLSTFNTAFSIPRFQWAFPNTWT